MLFNDGGEEVRAAHRAVKPGGALIFDVSTPYKLQHVLCSGLMAEDRENITYMWQNSWNDKQRTVSLDLVFFVREKDNQYRRIEEHQKQRAWDEKTLKENLWHAGFRAVSIYGDFTLNSSTERNQRWHVAATRAEDEE